MGHEVVTDIGIIELDFSAVNELYFDRSEEAVESQALIAAQRTICEALVVAATRKLQIQASEIGINQRPSRDQATDSKILELYVFDAVPGGAELSHQVLDYLDILLPEAYAILKGCDCETSCYRCIRSYGNRFVHNDLNRHLGAYLLSFVLNKSADESAECARGLLINPHKLEGFKQSIKDHFADSPVQPVFSADGNANGEHVNVVLAPIFPFSDPLRPALLNPEAEDNRLCVVPVDMLTLRSRYAEQLQKAIQLFTERKVSAPQPRRGL
jgi:hypothetical protein